MPWRHPCGIRIVVFRALLRDTDPGGSSARVASADGRGQRRTPGAAKKSDRGLLGAGERECCCDIGHGAYHQSAVVAPGERDPGPVLWTLVAKDRGLLKRLIVIDA